MKNNKLGTWLQNKMVLAALLMLLVAGTAFAGVLAMRNGDAGEQEETEPGYAFQTQEDDQVRDQLLEQPLEGLQGPDGLLQRPDRELDQIDKADKEENPDTAHEDQQDRPVQSGKIDAVTGDQKELDSDWAGFPVEDLTEINSEQMEAETLVAGEDAVVYEPNQEAEEVIAPGTTLDFQAGSTMGWPVFGNVLLDYSMDTTIYFPTLKQYKCNPGILIQAEVGQPVAAAVRGQVLEIGANEELGKYIMMDLGGDYTICYGQLEEIQVTTGQMVEPGQVLGQVAQPTKYYVVEGPNIYVEMRYQEEPVDPLDYIR